jgi:hypothetical protein
MKGSGAGSLARREKRGRPLARAGAVTIGAETERVSTMCSPRKAPLPLLALALASPVLWTVDDLNRRFVEWVEHL